MLFEKLLVISLQLITILHYSSAHQNLQEEIKGTFEVVSIDSSIFETYYKIVLKGEKGDTLIVLSKKEEYELTNSKTILIKNKGKFDLTLKQIYYVPDDIYGISMRLYKHDLFINNTSAFPSHIPVYLSDKIKGLHILVE